MHQDRRKYRYSGSPCAFSKIPRVVGLYFKHHVLAFPAPLQALSHIGNMGLMNEINLVAANMLLIVALERHI
ncbi:hypothetical protein SAMN05216332_10832 [Nitrosospira briensis]|nr:hypothetical protein SAMN05216332_10832 [Nitrosospira briensis]